MFDSFKCALSSVGIEDWEQKLIGFGCAGASVNIAAGGLRGHLEQSKSWVVVFWCLAHRLELSLKDVLKGTLFSSIDNMLMHAYYMYEKSPKKCHDLEGVVTELKACLQSMYRTSYKWRKLATSGLWYMFYSLQGSSFRKDS